MTSAEQRVQAMYAPAGAQADAILGLWWLTLAICLVVLVAVLGTLLFALWRRPRATPATPPDLSSLARREGRLEWTVGGALAASVLGLFVLLVASFLAERSLAGLPTDDALKVELIAHRWWWEARYDDAQPSRMFTTANELHIPVGRPVLLTLKSGDVIHSFWVPALGGKKDLIPGRVATLALRADQPGVYRGQCAEFCGLQHAKMALHVVAEPAEQYEAWAERQRQSAPEPADEVQKRGRQLFVHGTCAMCHTIIGTPAQAKLGPDLTHVAGRRTIAAGTLPMTKGHLAGWIVDPHRVKPGVYMPANSLSPDDLQALVAYLDALK